MRDKMLRKKKSQVWVETVVYTLIGLAVIGILLAVVRPKIASTKDQLIIQQTIDALNKFDAKMIEIKQAVGNSRYVEFQISDGVLDIDARDDKESIAWKKQGSSYKYSEPGQEIKIGTINILTEQHGDVYDIILSLDYAGIANLKIEGSNTIRTLQSAKTPYRLLIENEGADDKGVIVTNIKIS